MVTFEEVKMMISQRRKGRRGIGRIEEEMGPGPAGQIGDAPPRLPAGQS
jgi:hypothetical protein